MGDRNGIPPVKNFMPLISKGSVLTKVEEETKGNQLTKLQLENGF